MKLISVGKIIGMVAVVYGGIYVSIFALSSLVDSSLDLRNLIIPVGLFMLGIYILVQRD